MSDPYVGEIRLFAGTFAPAGWQNCDGSLLSIAEWSVLFNLIGTTYGGNGTTTFAVPDLRGRLPVHQGQGSGLSNYIVGQIGGTESVAITQATMPQHSHTFFASTTVATQRTPTNNVFGTAPTIPPSAQAELYITPGSPAPTLGALQAGSISTTTALGQAHDNVMPYQCFMYIISLEGIFPTQ